VVVLTNGNLRAEFAPEAGMVCMSLRDGDVELLGQRGGLQKYRETGSTCGIPLLHPWANRLDMPVDSPRVRIDGETGLPIHGLMNGWPEWDVTEVTRSAITARFDFGAHPELLSAFPYPHVIAVRGALDAAGLTIATRITATGGGAPVPIAFGWHPYFNLADDASVTLPVRTRIVLDERKLPTGAAEPVDYPPDMPLAGHAFDDGYQDVPAGASFVLKGGGRALSVDFLRGYPYAQVFAPPGQGLVAFEPMTAPANALRSGNGLRRETGFEAVFRVVIRTLP
jgi:galactose mutarotase-like enzyme